jgi:hypothetical protein
MNTYLFTVPLVAGKTEAWKNYLKEINGARYEDYKKSRKNAGIKTEQVYLQQTPHGDMCVVMFEGDNPQKSLETIIKSEAPFDKWFREKVLVETHGLDLSKPMPQNQHVLDHRETTIREFAGTKKN